MIPPLDDRERALLRSLCNARAGTPLVINTEFGEMFRRANALLEQYERIAPDEGRRVWAAAFNDHLRDRRLAVATDEELEKAREHADRALTVFFERFGGSR